MSKSAGPITFETVRALGLELPGAEEGTVYGSPALKVKGQMFACMAIHKSAEPNTLAVWIPFDQRDELLAAAADSYYLTDHYIDYPTVLVRLSHVHRDALRDLLRMAHRFVTAKRAPRAPRRTGSRQR